MLRVGLTGGIGCGKSAVADFFSDLGVAVIDTDAIAHQLTLPGGAALPAIQTGFGDEVLQADGALDRAAMRRLIFSDTGARNELEAILHPLIYRSVCEKLQLLGDAPYVLIVVPLLVEKAHYQDLIDRILVVDCLESQQIARVAARSGLRLEETTAIMAVQVDRASRLAAADDVLNNQGDWAGLQQQISLLHQKYLEISAIDPAIKPFPD
ncbi:MAG: dephospho-CoA kinase [Thiobacillaceae bacterium]